MDLISSIASTVFSAMITHGGWSGLVAALLLFWSVHKEASLSKKEVQAKSDTKMLQDLFNKREKELKSKISELETIIEELRQEIKSAEKSLYSTERDRISDLKAMLSEYHSTATDTLRALEKFEFFIVNRRP